MMTVDCDDEVSKESHDVENISNKAAACLHKRCKYMIHEAELCCVYRYWEDIVIAEK